MKEEIKDLIMVRGVPGCGKTSFANLISQQVLSADDYFTDKDGNYNWSLDKIGEAHAWCQAETKRAMEHGLPKICVANTSTTERELKPYYDLAKKYGYKVYSIVVENRHNGVDIHNVPIETLEKMEKRFNIKLR